jgi:hypothetical protein
LRYDIKHLDQLEHDMTNVSKIKAAGLAGILAAVVATVTSDLKAAEFNNVVNERQAVVTELGANSSATTYWVSEPDGWQVVTTVDTLIIGQDSGAELHSVVRFSSVILSGQSQVISVGERQQQLRIRRLGDRIEVARVNPRSRTEEYCCE